MGFDMTLQALPAGCAVLERARSDVEYGGSLILVPNLFQSDRSQAEDLDSLDLWADLQALARLHPGIGDRNCELTRWYDKLHFLLSANRRGGPGGAADELLDRAIRGAEDIADHACGCQGVPVRFVPPGDVKPIASLLWTKTADDLRPYYDETAMEAAGVYKFAPGLAERDWEHLPRFLDDLRRFYAEAARHGEGVLVCID